MSRIVHGITYPHRVVHRIKYKTGYALEEEGVGTYTYVIWDKGVEPEIVPWECVEKFVGWYGVTLPRSPVVKVLNKVSVTLDIPTEIEYGGRVYILKERVDG